MRGGMGGVVGVVWCGGWLLCVAVGGGGARLREEAVGGGGGRRLCEAEGGGCVRLREVYGRGLVRVPGTFRGWSVSSGRRHWLPAWSSWFCLCRYLSGGPAPMSLLFTIRPTPWSEGDKPLPAGQSEREATSLGRVIHWVGDRLSYTPASLFQLIGASAWRRVSNRHLIGSLLEMLQATAV